MAKIIRGEWSPAHFLAVAAVAALAAIVMPGCVWMFNWGMPKPADYYVVPGGGRGGGALLYPAPPPQVLEAKSPFVLPAVGYRSLGGVFIYAGQLVIVKAPGESGAAPRASDIATGLAFGRLVAEHHIDRLNTVVAADCLGSGERDDPIQLRDIAAPDDSVAAGIACARLRNPGAHWIGSNLMINDRQALSHVVLERLDNTQIDLYMDVSRFARHHGALP